MVNFIKSKYVSDGSKVVLFQTGNYQYEIWNQRTGYTYRNLYETSFEDAVKIFNEM
jgi:hypothetical protein